MTSSSEGLDESVLTLIKRSRRRLVLSRLLAASLDSLVFIFLTLLAIATLGERFSWSSESYLVSVAGLGLVVSAYLAYCALSGTSSRSVAILLDERLGFHDRISSALAFSRRPVRSAFMRAHLAETVAFLEKNADQVLPFESPGRGRALALFVALVLLALLPHSDHRLLAKRDRQLCRQARSEKIDNLACQMRRLRREADIRGLKKLSRMVAIAEEEVNRQIEVLAPEDLEPPELPESKKRPESEQDSLRDPSMDTSAWPERRGPGGGWSDESVPLSSRATYQPFGKFDSFPQAAYTEVFAELDEYLLDEELSGEELSALAGYVEGAASQLGMMGVVGDHDNLMDQRGILGPDGESIEQAQNLNSFERALAPLQQKSFSEFLKRYAAHLGEQALGRARFELSQAENEGGEVFNVSAPPSKDAKFALRGTTDAPAPDMPILQGTAEQAGEVASQAASGRGGKGKPRRGQVGGGTSPGGAGAGAGASERLAGAPPVLPRAQGGNYLPLEGRLSDGKAVVQVINDRGRRNLPARSKGDDITYHEVFVEYAQGAEAELNSERVPEHMRGYIRDYFRSIRPGLE